MNQPLDRRRRFFGWVSIGSIGLLCLIVLVSVSRSGEAQSAGPGRWLEFDVPNNASITGVVVGYFVPGQDSPAFSFEVARAQLESPRAGVLRVPLIVAKLPAGQTYEVRLRTLSKRQRSGWSEPSGRFTVPEDGGAPATAVGVPEASAKRPPDRPAAAKAPKAGGRSALNELKNNPELSAKLSKQFPGVDPTAAAAGFRTVRDLGAALFLASNLDVPFPELKKLTADAGNRDFAKAIATLKPGVNAKAEEQKAIKQSRQTFRAPAKSRK